MTNYNFWNILKNINFDPTSYIIFGDSNFKTIREYLLWVEIWLKNIIEWEIISSKLIYIVVYDIENLDFHKDIIVHSLNQIKNINDDHTQ